MHSYMQTGLAFTSVGLLIMKFLSGIFYFCVGGLFIILGAVLIVESGKRYMRFRRAIARLRQKEAKLGYEIGMVKTGISSKEEVASCRWPPGERLLLSS